MMDMETVRQYLSNLHENYKVDVYNANTMYKAKCLGAMESLLVVLGVLQPGVPFEFKKKPLSFKLFWLIPVSIPRKEGYPEMILRLAEETINSKQ
jgi:hypothetical protein